MLCLAGCLNTNTQSFLSRLSRSSLVVGNQLPIRQTRCSPCISTQTPPPLQDQSSTSLDVYWALASRPLRFYFSTRWCMLVSHACWRSLGIFWDSTGVEVISNGVQFRKKGDGLELASSKDCCAISLRRKWDTPLGHPGFLHASSPIIPVQV